VALAGAAALLNTTIKGPLRRTPVSSQQMEHSSHPGFYDAPLSLDAAAKMERIADVMVPAADGFPAAGPIVAAFVSDRIDPIERDLLQAAFAEIDATDDESLTAWISQLELDAPETFVMLRSWVYYGYYSSGAVATALQLSGSRYHGAPQPFGYRIDEDAPVPSTPRGSYLTTEEVRRVI
jgi:hypothetical protein